MISFPVIHVGYSTNRSLMMSAVLVYEIICLDTLALMVLESLQIYTSIASTIGEISETSICFTTYFNYKVKHQRIMWCFQGLIQSLFSDSNYQPQARCEKSIEVKLCRLMHVFQLEVGFFVNFLFCLVSVPICIYASVTESDFLQSYNKNVSLFFQHLNILRSSIFP